MAIQMQLWSIQGDRPVRLPSAKLDLEARLEQWICHDLSLVGEDLLLVGNQVTTDYGHSIDVLALDREGNLVVLELKRGRTPRDVVAQVLDYASWAHGLSPQDVEGLVEKHRQRSLEELFRERFHIELPESLNQEQRLVIIATELDPQSERIVQFLSAQYGVNINVVFFDFYRHNDQEFVGRSWLIAPEEVQRKAETLGPSKRRQNLGLEDLARLADDRGVGALYKGLHDRLSRLCDHVGTTQSNASYRWRSPSGSRSALVSVHPKASGPEPGLIADIRVDDLAKKLGLAPDDLRAALPEKLRPQQIPGLYVYAEAYAFRTREDVDRFLTKLGSAAAELQSEPVPTP